MKGKPGRDNNNSTEEKREAIYLRRLSFETGRQLYGAEPLASMEYSDELRCKDRAFSSYWYEMSGSCAAEALIPSPLPRRYRTTTKRRIHRRGGLLILAPDESSLQETTSLLEPEFHSAVYSELSSVFNEDRNRRLSGFLNFVIIRGNYDTAAVIFNVKVMNSETVNGLTKIAENLSSSNQKLNSAFIYHDPEGSKYYLNSASDVDGPRMKRLFGHRNLSCRVNDIIYTYPPEGFSQVNLSICGEMLGTAERLLKHDGGGRLIDLYCGYGFFSCYLAGKYDEVTGIDYGDTAIDSARENMKRIKHRVKWDFHARRIDKKTLQGILPQNRVPEYMLLDPSRNGTAPGVIETIAARSPELVLNVFCGLETIPYELAKWGKSGYRAVQCVPLDMFPGTPELEVMILLKKTQSLKTRVSLKSGR